MPITKPLTSDLNRLKAQWRRHPTLRRCAGHYIFNERIAGTALDISGNRRHGTPTGTSLAAGKFGHRTRNFNGTSDFISLPLSFTAPPFTFMCWIRPAFVTNGEAAIWLGDSATADSRHWLGPGWVNQNDLIAATRQNTGSDGGAVATSVLIQNVWQHICGVWVSESSRLLYLNGRQVATDTTNVVPEAINTFTIGRHSDSTPGSYYSGQLEDVRVYDIALSEAMVMTIYRNTMAPFEWADKLMKHRAFRFPAAPPTGPPVGTLALLGAGV